MIFSRNNRPTSPRFLLHPSICACYIPPLLVLLLLDCIPHFFSLPLFFFFFFDSTNFPFLSISIIPLLQSLYPSISFFVVVFEPLYFPFYRSVLLPLRHRTVHLLYFFLSAEFPLFIFARSFFSIFFFLDRSTFLFFYYSASFHCKSPMFLPIFWIIFVASLPFFCFCSLHHHRLVSSFLFSCVTFHLFLYPSRHAFCYILLFLATTNLLTRFFNIIATFFLFLFIHFHRPYTYFTFSSPSLPQRCRFSTRCSTFPRSRSCFLFQTFRHVSARKKEGISIGK